MARARKIPAYTLHTPSGQARVRINGKDHYLGPHKSEASRKKYDRLIAKYLADDDRPTEPWVTISQIMVMFWRHAKVRYGKSGKGKYGTAINWRPIIRLVPPRQCPRPLGLSSATQSPRSRHAAPADPQPTIKQPRNRSPQATKLARAPPANPPQWPNATPPSTVMTPLHNTDRTFHATHGRCLASAKHNRILLSPLGTATHPRRNSNAPPQPPAARSTS